MGTLHADLLASCLPCYSVRFVCFPPVAPVRCFGQWRHASRVERSSWAPGSRLHRCMAVLADKPPAFPGNSGGGHKVEEFMTKGSLLTVGPETPLGIALKLLVDHDITGLPVVGDDGRVVGVVSDFDLLSMDVVSGKMQSAGMFPNANTDWGTFHEVQRQLAKNEGRVVGDVMTSDPFVVREFTDFKTAARILLDRKIRRLPVVDGEGRLMGIFSRKDVIRAALQLRDEVN